MAWDGHERRKNQLRCQTEILDKIEDLQEKFSIIEKQVLILMRHVESEKGNLVVLTDKMEDLLEKHNNTLYGDGSKEHVGNCERLNILEDDFEGRKKEEDKKNTHLFGLWVGVGLMAIKTIWDFITGK